VRPLLVATLCQCVNDKVFRALVTPAGACELGVVVSSGDTSRSAVPPPFLRLEHVACPIWTGRR
jgi:hypothetical protein